MSALPPKADMYSALADVCFGPKADIRRLKYSAGLTLEERAYRRQQEPLAAGLLR
jgi:hypothetical protein